MVDRAAQAILAAMDVLLGWLLAWPTDAVILVVAVATSLVLVLVRRWTTDQDLLKRVAEDKRRQKVLAAEARERGDMEAARRHKANRAAITLRSMPRLMRGEALTLLASVVPIALVATWCFYRLEYHPPRAGKPIEVALDAPVSAVGQVAHLVPQEGLSADGGWVRIVTADKAGEPRGIATWTLRAEERVEPYALILRVGDRSFKHALLVGQRQYLPPRADHGDGFITEVRLREVKLFGRLPGVPRLYLPAWMTAYLIVAIAMTFVLKRCFGIE